MAATQRKRPAVTPGHTTDIRIGICRGIGVSREDTAVACGVSVPTVDLRSTEPVMREWREWAAGLLALPSVNHKTHMEQQMIRRAGKALESIDRAMNSDDDELALRGSDRVLDRVLPKTQKVETTSEITERHVLEIPEETLARLQEFTASLRPKQLESAQIIDVTPEDDT